MYLVLLTYCVQLIFRTKFYTNLIWYLNFKGLFTPNKSLSKSEKEYFAFAFARARSEHSLTVAVISVLIACRSIIEGWGLQPRWKGPKAVLYVSLDDSDRLVFMEGTQELNHIPLVSGQVFK